jgi:hypothetical protein
MGSRDRPRREPKKKPKDAASKPTGIQPILESPMSVELIKPKRKPREEIEEE